MVFDLYQQLQWGHDLAVMERLQRLGRGMRTAEGLQWGHDLAVMESWTAFAKLTLPFTLQWGHDLAVMESPRW